MTALSERKIGREITSAVHDSTGAYELVIGAIAAGGFGALIDLAFGTFPTFMLIFGIVGFISAGVSLYYRYKLQMEAAGAERAARTAGEVVGDVSTAGDPA